MLARICFYSFFSNNVCYILFVWDDKNKDPGENKNKILPLGFLFLLSRLAFIHGACRIKFSRMRAISYCLLSVAEQWGGMKMCTLCFCSIKNTIYLSWHINYIQFIWTTRRNSRLEEIRKRYRHIPLDFPQILSFFENIITGMHFNNKKNNQKLKHGGK